MRITYYNSTKYEKTTTEEANIIWGNYEPNEMDEETREELRSGELIPMCNFETVGDGSWKSIPWSFVIKIEE